MTTLQEPSAANGTRMPVIESPFLRAPEPAKSIFVIMIAAACLPLLGGWLLFGWRAVVVTFLSLAGCVVFEKLYYRIAQLPVPPGESHSYLTGILLAMTLPAFVPWYVPLTAAAFAILVGKAFFGGVGHFLWQPALVGRLAVAVMFPSVLMLDAKLPDYAPVLAQNKLVIGDVRAAQRPSEYRQWEGTAAPGEADALLLRRPDKILSELGHLQEPPYSALLFASPDMPHAAPAALKQLPPLTDFLLGARGGGIGETCSVAILLAGLYLIYRNYVKWQLPISFLLGASAVALLGPIMLNGPNDTTDVVMWPLINQLIAKEGLDVGLVYLSYQLLSGELLLAAFFLATEMTSRPVTGSGQALFGALCGLIGMGLRMYLDTPIPFYMAVLAMNTFTPLIDTLWRPRVLGQRYWFLK